MSVYDRFNRLLQGRAPLPNATMRRPFQLPDGQVPPMALMPGAKPPQSSLTANQKLSPMMQQILRNAQTSRMTPAAGQVNLTPPEAAAGGPAGMTFEQKLMQPRAQGMLNAAAAGFEASGYQDRPVSLGQVLGRMGTAGMKAYITAKDKADKAAIDAAARKAAAEKAAFARRLQLAQFYQREREISGVKSKEAKANEINQVKLERDLRKDFETYSKPFTEAQRFFKDVINFSGEDNTSAQDLALVFSYMKLLDPGSVVREGEQYQVRDLGSIPDSFRVMLSRYGFFQDANSPEGKMLLPQSVRNSIREASMEKYSDSLGSQLEVESEYAGYGKRAELNKNYFRPKIQQNGSIKSPYLVNSVEEGEAKAKSGEYFVVSGDGFYRKD